MTYEIVIRATIEARNFESARRKCVELEKAVARKAAWHHVELRPRAKDDEIRRAA